MCPTATSGPFEDMVKMFAAYKEVKENGCDGADFIGMHMEGPYFALSQMGAQDPKFIRDPDPAEYEKLLDATDDIVRWSIAPERDIDYVFAKKLSEITVSLKAEAGEGGRFYGAVTAKDIAEELSKLIDAPVDKRKILLKDSIKAYGKYSVELKVHPEVTATFFVLVHE
jgi:hypothetical protein